jgi:UBX domain-containing protein 1
MMNVPFGKQVEIKVSHNLDRDYEAPKKPVSYFSGGGNRLGGISNIAEPPLSLPGGFPQTNATSSSGQSSSNQPSSPVASQILIDASKPTTSVQIRLADGTRYLI